MNHADTVGCRYNDSIEYHYILKHVKCVSVYNDILYCYAVTDAERTSEFAFTKGTPYLTLSYGGVSCENFGEIVL